MSGNYFFHVHFDECKPVCVLDKIALATYIEHTPRPLLYDDEASVERLAAVMLKLADTPKVYMTPREAALTLIAALRGEGSEYGQCGSLAWTIKAYGRVTHKHSCPNRTDPWCQQHPESCDDRLGREGS